VSGVRLRATVGDLPILAGGLVESIRGNWTGTVAVHGAPLPDEGSPASIVFLRETGAEDAFVGVVRRRGSAVGQAGASVTVVGGAGKLLADLPPRDHAPGVTEIPAGLVAKGIADDAGERLAAGVELGLDGRTVHRWTRIACPARDALDLLVDVLGWGWRVQRDGSVWAGQETWPSLDVTKFLEAVPDEQGAVYACDGAPIRPGVTLTTPDGAIRVAEVVYSITAGASRATVRPAVAGDPPPVRRSRELYEVAYAAMVREQAADGSLVVTCDDPRVDVLRGVPLRVGIPGALVTVPVGARLRVRFEGADPRGAYAEALDQDPSATTAVALVGQSIGYLTATAPPGGGPCALALSPVVVPNSVQLTNGGPGSVGVKLR